MADQFTMAPLSGEIMAGPQPSGERLRSAPEPFVDAEYETLPRATPNPPAPRSADCGDVAAAAVSRPGVVHPVSSPSQGMNMLRGMAMPVAGPRSSRGGAGFWLAGFLLAAIAFWVSGGHTLARLSAVLPGADAEPFRVASLASRVETADGRSMLIVDGTVAIASGARSVAPQLTIKVTAADGGVARYRLWTGRETIAGSATWRFSSRLEAPRSGVRSVSATVVPEG